MKMDTIRVRVITQEQLLGMASNNPEIHEEFIASKAPNATNTTEEIEALGLEAVIEKGKTVFPKDEKGNPFMWDYQIKGFFKDACGSLRKVPGTVSNKISNYKKIIDGLIFVQERKIFIQFAGNMSDCQRPLRAQTPQGERVALANSESIPAGAVLEFTVAYFPAEKVTLKDALIEWLDYGEYRGLGQWRNSGAGRFLYEILDSKGKVIGGNNV